MQLRALIEKHQISQVELARGIGRSEAFVSRLLGGETGASQETIAALLAFLSEKTGRRVTYEQIFSAPVAS